MPLEDYLMPNENIRYQSDFDVFYAGKPYTVILTDLRLILYARRGLLIKGDDVITDAIREVQGIKYRETGMLIKVAHLIVQGKTTIDLTGNQASIKALYQRLLPFLSPELRQPSPNPNMYYQPVPPPNYQTPVQQPPAGSSSRFCIACGIELAPNSKFCNNCGKPQ